MRLPEDRNVRRSLAQVEEQLATEFPTIDDAEAHAEVMQVAQILLEAARFTDYVPLLTYRYARDRLVNRGPVELRSAA